MNNPAPTILIVDDEPEVLVLLGRILSSLGYSHQKAASGVEALQYLQRHAFDGVLLDIDMPGINGIELLRNMEKTGTAYGPAVIMISGNNTLSQAIEAMKLGADDYIQKPFQYDEISLSLSRALERRELRRQVRAYQTRLEQMVMERTSQLQQMFIHVIQSLVFALEAKDRYTNGHSHRVAWLAENLARSARLDGPEVELIQIGAMFHDLGKIGIRESILLKESALTAEERAQIQKHPEIGVKILEPIQELQKALPLVLHHHEQYDGSGYPAGLSGENIPQGARIIAVADAFDTLTTDRPYCAARTPGNAMAALCLEAGRQFDPALIELLIKLADDPAVACLLQSEEWKTNRPRGRSFDPGLMGIGGESGTDIIRRD